MAGYEQRLKSSGKPECYRFINPKSSMFPAMIELFSRRVEGIALPPDAVLTPLPIDDEISSLSAILIDNDYYDFLRAGVTVADGIPVIGAAHLIPFKAKAWLDLTERKANGNQVDSRHIDDEHAKGMHASDEMRPFSLFARVQQSDIALRLSFLHEAADPLLELARTARSIDITGLDGGIAILDRIEKPAATIEQLRKPAPKEFRMLIASPASYKHNGRVSNLYSLPPLLYTVAAKQRKYEGIDMPNEEVFALCELVNHMRYELRAAGYIIAPGIARPGFEGELLLRPGGSVHQRDKLALLLRYAAYAGIGAKTALGMGGILLFEF